MSGRAPHRLSHSSGAKGRANQSPRQLTDSRRATLYPIRATRRA